MLSLYTGTPGSYKSYHAVDEICRILKFGGRVIANFKISDDFLKSKQCKGTFIYVNNRDITCQYFIDFARKHHSNKIYKCQTFVYIDEASILFNQRVFGKSDKVARLNWINFFANSRHFGYDFILIVQQDKMIDAQIRALVESEFRHRSIKHYKLFGSFLSKFFKMFFVIEVWYPARLKVGATPRFFHLFVARRYDTMGNFLCDDCQDQNFNDDRHQIITTGIEVPVNDLRKNIQK